jgi:putative ABC transport system substrate-binding protein
LPAIGTYREFAAAGGLMSYGQDIRENYRRAASYIDKIFKGSNPGDLAIEQSTKFELLINVRTAKALGLTIPKDLLVRADEVVN